MRISDWSSDVCSSDLLEERPAAPQNHWCGERQLRPLRPCRFDQPVETDPGHHVAHRVDEQRQGEERADPEAAGNVDKFGIGSILKAHRLGLECHSADGAASRSYLADLGMHGTGVDRPFGNVIDLIEMRSEEHTSELKSLMRISYAVFCLKKK